MRIACIGTRNLRGSERQAWMILGRLLVLAGHELVSGNALGSDQAAAAGGSAVDPRRVTLCLPWPGYEREAIVAGNVVLVGAEGKHFEEAARFHPVWARLSIGARKLQARNVVIVERADVVVALPDASRIGDGGTGQGMRVGRGRGIPVVDLTRRLQVERLRELVGEQGGAEIEVALRMFRDESVPNGRVGRCIQNVVCTGS